MKQHEPCRVSGLVSVAWSAEGLSLCGLIFVPRIEWSPTHLVAPWMPCFCPPGHALELPRFAEGSKAKTETAHWTAEVGQLVQFSVYCRLKSSMNWQAQQFSEMLCWLVVKQPLWKIWVHQLGWLLFPTEWNNKKSSKPPTSMKCCQLLWEWTNIIQNIASRKCCGRKESSFNQRHKSIQPILDQPTVLWCLNP